ncbi:hypothetical protein PM082_018030 [Marasmius tenuissimus]|nr:hypothetical protein PM082_018030 [Marasmius tenuissimus]
MPLPTSESNQADTECSLLQKEEWEVIESIYPDYISQSLDEEGSIRLELPVEFGEPRSIQVVNSSEGIDSPETTKNEVKELSLSTLPPLLLHIILPQAYPVKEAPSLLSIRATHLWLQPHHIARLHTRLMERWSEVEDTGQGVLYNWIEYLYSGGFLEDVGMLNNNTILIHHPSPPLLAPLLEEHQALSASNTFNQTSYPCSVCLEHFKGSKCLQLSCNHIFCRKCLQDFWDLCITEGDIERVGCPDPECVKEGRQASEEEVARAVSGGEEQLSRWRWLREKAAIEKDPTIIHCPMSFCQRPVPKPRDLEGQEESGWDRLRTCPSCSYSFCAFCKRTWHGPISACPISASETLVLEYLALPETSAERTTMERRFGRKNIVRLVDRYHEEQANKKWLDSSTMACAGCGVSVEKSLGCNHMTCAKCKTHFCYKCGQKLQPTNPYKHFSTPGQPCFNKLFDVNSELDMDDWEMDVWADL